jgi:hypothetical protein
MRSRSFHFALFGVSFDHRPQLLDSAFDSALLGRAQLVGGYSLARAIEIQLRGAPQAPVTG